MYTLKRFLDTGLDLSSADLHPQLPGHAVQVGGMGRQPGNFLAFHVFPCLVAFLPCPFKPL